MRLAVLPFVACFTAINAQDFMSFLKPFLGSGLAGNNEAGGGSASGIGSLLNTFASTGNSAGPGSNMPFAEFAQLGMSLLNKGGGLGALGGGGGRVGPSPAGAISAADYDEADRAEQRREQQITQAQRERQQQMRRSRVEKKEREKMEAQKRNEEMRRRREENRLNREIARKEKGIEREMGNEQMNRLQRARMAKRRRELAASTGANGGSWRNGNHPGTPGGMNQRRKKQLSVPSGTPSPAQPQTLQPTQSPPLYTQWLPPPPTQPPIAQQYWQQQGPQLVQPQLPVQQPYYQQYYQLPRQYYQQYQPVQQPWPQQAVQPPTQSFTASLQRTQAKRTQAKRTQAKRTQAKQTQAKQTQTQAKQTQAKQTQAKQTQAKSLIRRPLRQPFTQKTTPIPTFTLPKFPTFPTPPPTPPPTSTITQKPFSLPTDFTFPPDQNNHILEDRVKAFAQPNRVLKLLQEVSEYSPVQQTEGDSMRKLMHAFFGAMANMNAKQASSIQLEPMYDGTEMGANRPLTNQLFESDMVLTVEQMKGIVLAAGEGGKRTKRKVITGGVYRWPKGAPIPYRFKGGTEEWKTLIRKGLSIWESETCVRWREDPSARNHLVFIRGSGCYSSVGRVGGGQAVSIGYGCDDAGIVTHEVGHSLGFWHEQSRPDRDDYIVFNRGVVIRGTEGNFAKRTTQETEDMGLPYDLGSVMHYGPTAFTTDWDEHTLITKDKQFQRTIGQRRGPSFIDVKQVNRLYCNDVCPQDLGCEHGGYVDPNNCNRCKCPPGLSGVRCERVQQSTRLCGGELTATGLWQEISFRGKGECFWRIRAENARIRFVLSKVEYRCEEVCKAYIEIKANSDFQQTGFRKCCDDGEIERTSEQSELLLLHTSTILEYETKFNLRYIMDSGSPLPPRPPPIPTNVWVPGKENRNFRGSASSMGPVEQFILNALPRVRDVNRPMESMASIVTDWTLKTLLGVSK
ncbi:unnamed protein product, partial [Mesorhabditis belari]|uniref:Metalloendopeptidase n=1 Tax=Mesorhabditis belari TaxID=2138241 RepID=A0AAF3F457_9BILA